MTTSTAADSPLLIDGKTCHTSKSASKTDKAFILADFGQDELIYKIEIFNPAIKGGSSHLEDAVVYVGDKICTKIDSSPPVDAVISLECINVNKAIKDERQTEIEEATGVTASSIKIESRYQGDFSACDITVIAKQSDQAVIDELKADYAVCKKYQ